jgi:hypothetical protein
MLLMPTAFVIIILAGLGALVVVGAWAVVRLLGRVTGTPRRFTMSTIVVTLATFFACFFTLIQTLRPLRWDNGQPQNWQSGVWPYSVLISAALALVAVLGWQVFLGWYRRRAHVPT